MFFFFFNLEKVSLLSRSEKTLTIAILQDIMSSFTGLTEYCSKNYVQTLKK